MKATKNPRILVVDDNPAIHEDFRKILSSGKAAQDKNLEAAEAILFGEAPRHAGRTEFDLSFASQGQEAAKLVKQALTERAPYAVAFVDVRMPPGWDGVETAVHLWDLDPNLQIVICTAYSDYLWEEIAQRLGRSDSLLILKKPFDNIEVLQLAHALTKKWHVTKQANLRLEELDRLVVERTDQLRASEERLRQAQKMEAIGHLAAGVAHDFNNILTVIQGHSSLQLARHDLDQETSESIQQMAAAADRATALTRQLLAFSRKQVMQRGPLDLNALLHRLSKMLRRLIGEHIELVFDCAPTLNKIHGDATNIEQIILNLVLNARDAMPKGGCITISTSPTEIEPEDLARNPEAVLGMHVCLSVRDTGVGMTTEVQKRIFEPFFTTKEPGIGTGMGLSTVHGIVKQHGGWLEVESSPGMGSMFFVYLPTSPFEEASELQGESAAIPPGEGRTILIVEDEEPVRRLIHDVLGRNGYRVLEAANPQEALLRWKQHGRDITLLFTDMVMPGGMSGQELAAKLRSERQDLRVIFTSGYDADTGLGVSDLREGYNYLQKPYQTSALAGILRRILSNNPSESVN